MGKQLNTVGEVIEEVDGLGLAEGTRRIAEALRQLVGA